MDIFRWLIFLFIAFVSFLPLTRLRLFNSSKRYSHFKYVSIFLFLWTIIAWLQYVLSNPNQVYYLTLAVYPTLFILTVTLLVAIMYYLGKKIPKGLGVVLGIILFAELVVSFTNQYHHLMIDLSPGINLTLASFDKIPRGPGFFVHTIICYIILLVVFGFIFQKLFKDVKVDKDIMPFVTMGLGILLGVIFNVIHIFIFPFSIDPTYIAFVLLITTLYFVFYIRDLRLIIELGRNEFILDNFREMYLICNHRNVVVDASAEFLESFDIDLSTEMSFDDLLNHLKEKAVIYENPNELTNDFQSDKRYLHMQRKQIHLPLFRYQGIFYLFYDESNIRKYINDVEYVKSHDLMTELYNRNHFEEIKKNIDTRPEFYTLIMFDLDGLKFYNDYLGHSSGDNMLIRFSSKLKEISDAHDMIPIRLGGDEFLLISINPKPRVIEYVIQEVTKLSKVKNSDKKIIFSYGTAAKENMDEDIEKVFSKADNQMYKMKIEQEEQKIELQEYLKSLK